METKITISKDCFLSLVEYNDGKKDLELEYIEKQYAHGYSDNEEYVSIPKDKCAEIIKACMKYLNVDIERIQHIANVCRTENTQAGLSSMLAELDSSLEELNPDNYE